MKTIVSQKEFQAALSIVGRIVSTDSTNPVLSYLHVLAAEDEVTVTATNFQQSIRMSVPAQVEEGGSYLLNCRMLTDISRRLPDGDVTIESFDNSRGEGGNVIISMENIRINLFGYDTREFPSISFREFDSEFMFSRDTLEEMLSHVMVSIKKQDDANPILTGSLLRSENGMLTAVGLDGYRISLIRRPLPEDFEGTINEIVPRKVMEEVLSISRMAGCEDIGMCFRDGKVCFDMNGIRLISGLIEGQFINYDAIIVKPETMTCRILCESQALMRALDIAALISNQNRNKMVRLKVADGMLEVRANSEYGEFYRAIPVRMEGEGVEIAFNSTYLLDAVKSYDMEEIEMYFAGSLKPCLVTPKDSMDLHMLLPVRVRG